MRIEVRFFAMQRAQTGRRAYQLELPDGADVAGAWAALARRRAGPQPASSDALRGSPA